MIKLRIRIPGQPESIVTVDGDEALIGRSPECDVTLPVPFVSHQHAKIVTGVAIVDMNSTNGVWVNGAQVTSPSVLRDSTFYLGATPDASPSVEVLEVSAGQGADQARLEQLQREVEELRGRNAHLEQEVMSMRAQVSSEMAGSDFGDDATVLIPSTPVDAPNHSTPATPGPPPTAPSPVAPAEQPAQAPAGVPSFADFFHVGAPEPASAKSTPDPAPAPVPATAVPSPRDRKGVLKMIDGLIRDDVGDHLPIIQGPIEEFFTLESFRLLRQVERVITRLAREFKQLYDMTTMLPDSGGNFRSLAAEVLLDPDNGDQRQQLVDYLDELRRWLGVSLAANRKAALRLVVELKRDLSAEGLTVDEPIPSWMKALGKDQAEYWRRVQSYLESLDDESVEDRLEKYAKEFAIDVMENNQGSRDSLYH